eukprot:3791916-Pleurochrysis_carterae.AAC.1
MDRARQRDCARERGEEMTEGEEESLGESETERNRQDGGSGLASARTSRSLASSIRACWNTIFVRRTST